MGEWFNDSLSRGDLRRYTRKRLSSRKPNWFSKLTVAGWLIVINIGFFIIAMIAFFAGLPVRFIALQPHNLINHYYIWTLVTSMFMHGGILHLFINMFVLFSLGDFTEKIIGGKRFLWFYLISGIFAGLVFVVLGYFFGGSSLGANIFGGSLDFAVGASGAIFAVAGLLMVLIPKLKFSIIFFPFFSLPAYIMIPVVLFITWIVSSSVAIVAGTQVGIGNTAHFGGFLAGLIYGFYLRKKYPKKIKMLGSVFGR
jgi:uncharacterized protein